MALSKEVQANPEPSFGYNSGAYKWILHEEFNVLKARLLNLAESTSNSKEQTEAMKGLIKDFTNQCYYNSLHKMTSFLEFFNVIDGREGGNDPILEANSLKDVQVN